MKKMIIIMMAVIAVFTLASCTTGVRLTSEDGILTFEKVTVITGKYGEVRPVWVTKLAYSDKDYFYGVGYAKYSDENDARKLATVEAKNALTETIYTVSAEVIDTYNSELGKTYEIISRQKASAVLSGFEASDEWVAEDGTVFVLGKIKIDNVIDQLYMNQDHTAVTQTDVAELHARMEELVNQNDL